MSEEKTSTTQIPQHVDVTIKKSFNWKSLITTHSVTALLGLLGGHFQTMVPHPDAADRIIVRSFEEMDRKYDRIDVRVARLEKDTYDKFNKILEILTQKNAQTRLEINRNVALLCKGD